MQGDLWLSETLDFFLDYNQDKEQNTLSKDLPVLDDVLDCAQTGIHG